MNHFFVPISKLAILITLLLCCATAQAYGSLRCQGKLIRPGQDMAHILNRCGAPQDRVIEEVPVRSRVASGFTRFAGMTVVERWVYDRGWGKFPAVLIFQDGTLRRVDYLRYRSRGRLKD